MGRRPSLVFCITAVLALIVSSMPNSYAAKTGSACKQLNAKNWDGDNPIVCKKKKGKLIWSKFSDSTSTSKNAKPNSNDITFEVVIIEREAVGQIGLYSDQGDGSDSHGLRVCSQESIRWIGGVKVINYLKVTSATELKLKDASSVVVGLEKASKVSWQKTETYTSQDGAFTYPKGTCSFAATFKVKASDFFSLEIPNFSKPIDFSRQELEKNQFRLYLTI